MKFNKIFVLLTAALALGFSAIAQMNPGTYYSTALVATNTIITSTSTNFGAANYDSVGGWFATKGVTAQDPNATGLTLQFVYGGTGYYTNASATNVVFTIGTLLDAKSRVDKLPLYTAFTVTNTLPVGTNLTVNVTVAIPAASFQGAQWAKVTGVSYPGYLGGNVLGIISGRAGCWY